MLRQAVRKSPRKTVRKPTKRTAAKKSTAAKSTSTTVNTSTYLTRLKTFVDNLGSYVEQRKKNFSTKDPVHKKLHAIHSSLQRELKKKNAINPSTAKHLKALTPALRGVTKLPANVKGQVGKLMNFIRSEVNKEVMAQMKQFNSLITPMHDELSKLNKSLEADIKKVKNQKIQLKIDSSIKRRISALNTQMNRFKSKWFNRLNKINLHGNNQIKTQVKALKKKIEETQKLLGKNQTIVNRYAKTPKASKEQKTQILMKAGQVQSLESKMKNIDTTFEKSRIQFEHFCEQLKAVKMF